MNTSSTAKQAEPKLNSLRLLCTLYNALARELSIDLPASGKLETEGSAEDIRTWLSGADERIPVHQMRQFLQTSRLANRECLTAASEYFLSKAKKDDRDRDKLDFLLVQFLSMCASTQLQESDASLEFVARTLEPLLGEVEAALSEPLRPLEAQLKSANSCHSLLELYNSGILEQARTLKLSLGEKSFDRQTLVTVARFNFLMRRAFFQLMHQDLNAILEGLRKLELKGINTLDCRKAEFAEDEPISRLRMICQSWKVMFQAEYSSGQPLRLLADLRGVIDARLSEGAAKAEIKSQAQPETKTEAKAEVKTEAKTEANAEAKTEAKLEGKSEANPAGSAAPDQAVNGASDAASEQKAQAAAAAASGSSLSSGNSSKPASMHNKNDRNDRRGKRK